MHSVTQVATAGTLFQIEIVFLSYFDFVYSSQRVQQSSTKLHMFAPHSNTQYHGLNASSLNKQFVVFVYLGFFVSSASPLFLLLLNISLLSLRFVRVLSCLNIILLS